MTSVSVDYEQLGASLERFNKKQIGQAGQRYTPGIDSQAPNIKIDSINAAIENVACGQSALERFKQFLNKLSTTWESAECYSQRRELIQQKIDDACSSVAVLVERLRSRDVQARDEWVRRLSELEKLFQGDIDYWNEELKSLSHHGGSNNHSGEQRDFSDKIRAISRCLNKVRGEVDYVESPAFKVLYEPCLLVTGEWGTGKTHLLCDMTQERTCRQQLTVLILAKNFQGCVLSEISNELDKKRKMEEICDLLQKMSENLKERALILIDGVNEGQRQQWKEAISSLRKFVADRPNLGLIVSCRTPFESMALDENDSTCFHKINHKGFEDREFDAQAEFFSYYNLPASEVPLLSEEFSRPLTLKLICQSFRNLGTNKKGKGFGGIASGQRGMTYVFESFVKEVGGDIESKFKMTQGGCWHLLKGDKSFASYMAENLRDYVYDGEAHEIIALQCPSLSPSFRCELLDTLRSSGLLDEDLIVVSSKDVDKPQHVYRLPYQRLSDHLIARHLFEKYLDKSSAETIKASFALDSHLGRLFRIDCVSQEYVNPGWAQALITEFPERVRNKLLEEEQELFFMLPPDVKDLSAYLEPFVDGLFWRSPKCFTKGTEHIIARYLKEEHQVWCKVIDSLVAVSTKKDHPYRSQWLYDYLSKLSMADRDLSWSEYLRREYNSPAIRRLLKWAEELSEFTSNEEKIAEQLIVLFSLLLTTVVQADRDLATKALVVIGEKFPQKLFDHTTISLEFNDPYVPERMLAAAYGVTLSLVDSECAQEFLPILERFSKTLYKKMFADGAPYATHHALMRDYALGIIDVACNKESFASIEYSDSNLKAPFSSTPSSFSNSCKGRKLIKEAIGCAIRMDFGNYTIGKLIPERSNYDSKHAEYVKVRAQIERRIYDLGYRKSKFQQIDQEIDRKSDRLSGEKKVNRYGKKYSWIAYWEMWGERDAGNLLSDWRNGKRSLDSDVDPSFPKSPKPWNFSLAESLIGSASSVDGCGGRACSPQWQNILIRDHISDCSESWVLVEGAVFEAPHQPCSRKLTAFLRGLFIDEQYLESLKKQFEEVTCPNSQVIPESGIEICLFAGEAGRRRNYAEELLQNNGEYKRQEKFAFEDMSDNNKIPVELPAIHYKWGGEVLLHSQLSEFYLPAPRLIQSLGLATRNREVDFYDSEGRRATIYQCAEGEEGRYKFLYIRSDLLCKYLEESEKVLVWCNWWLCGGPETMTHRSFVQYDRR